MALTNPFDTATPAGGDDPKAGDDRIRELKDAIVEREEQDHYWPAVGTVYDNDDCGFHKKATLLVQSPAPASKANAIIIYGKDVDGKCELHTKDEDGNELQLTTGGAFNVTSEFVTGDLLFSSVTTAHAGWTNVTATYANRYLRVGNTVLGTGGSATLAGTSGSHTLTIAEIPGHTHPGPTVHNNGDLGTSDYQTSSGAGARAAVSSTGSTGGSSGHTHSLTSVANTPLYVDVRVFLKS